MSVFKKLLQSHSKILTAARRGVRSIQYRLDALEELSVDGFSLILVVLGLATSSVLPGGG